MSKIGVPRYTAGHTGKTGYITTQSVGAPKPFPFSIVEQGKVNSYPQYRKFLPTDIQPYSDEIYDFRTLPYKEWYDKRGKKHINRWWQQQLDAISLYERSKEEAKNYRQQRNTRPINNGSYYSRKYSSSKDYSKSIDLCCRKCKLKYRSTGQRPNSKRWSSRRKASPRYKY